MWTLLGGNASQSPSPQHHSPAVLRKLPRDIQLSWDSAGEVAARPNKAAAILSVECFTIDGPHGCPRVGDGSTFFANPIPSQTAMSSQVGKRSFNVARAFLVPNVRGSRFPARAPPGGEPQRDTQTAIAGGLGCALSFHALGMRPEAQRRTGQLRGSHEERHFP